MREVAIAGVAMTKFGISEDTCIEMFGQAATGALVKSDIEPKDIEALFLGNCLGDFEDGQAHMGAHIHTALGLPMAAPAFRFENACATATVAIRQAALMVGAGIYDVVLAGGTERVAAMDTPMATRTFAMASNSCYSAPTGITFPGVFAMAAHMYAGKYGMDISSLSEYMAHVSVKNHFHASMNPKAQFQKEISVEKVLESFMVADPLHFLDCCPFSDGASAVVIASKEKAVQMTDKPVYIIGTGQAAGGPVINNPDMTRIKPREVASAMAYKEAGVTPGDIDLCELHDCFTIAEILAIEGLGFYEFGKGYDAAKKGETRLGSDRTVINPSGGLKAKGHPIGATGAAQVTEIVEQLRGESKERQVEGARTGLVDTLGGEFGTVCNLILRSYA
ncbi:MAG: propanoyl-CoA acyltransferase [Deltaproteobacteria bacterium]|nr:propanoyl-CoA acyltransferase [Deltaproteobacteria bacterium]